jgi:hypothetical protein
MTSFYTQIIRETLAKIGRVGATDPRWVEGWLRLERGCLDALTADQFRQEIEIALECIDASTATQNEELARSYGL